MHKIERHCFRSTWPLCKPLPSMAANLLCPTGSPLSPRVPTSFVPPIHNQGVSSAFYQGRALWRRFLPTAGSFFVCLITDSLPAQHLAADVICDILPYSVAVQDTAVIVLLSLLRCLQIDLRPSDIADHLLWIVVHLLCQHDVEDPDQLTGDCHQ